MSEAMESILDARLGANLTALGWSADLSVVRTASPTAARGHNLIVIAPPTPAYATPIVAGALNPLLNAPPPHRRLVVVAGSESIQEWADVFRGLCRDLPLRILVADSLGRAASELRLEWAGVLISTVSDAVELQKQSALKGETIGGIVLAWPEYQDEADLATFMQDAPKEAQRILLGTSPNAVADLGERYTRKALSIAFPGTEAQAQPIKTRTAAVAWNRRIPALRDLIASVEAKSVVVWTVDTRLHDQIRAALTGTTPSAHLTTTADKPAELVLAFDLPTRADLIQLGTAAGRKSPVLLVPPGTERYVRSITSERQAIALPGFVGRLSTEIDRRRQTIGQQLDRSSLELGLLALTPLFERYEATEVAAAMYELWVDRGVSATTPPPTPVVAQPTSAISTRIWIGVGRKELAQPGDFVALLTRELALPRASIGRIDIRETFTLLELSSDTDAVRVAAGLNGKLIRRRKVVARVDRDGVKS